MKFQSILSEIRVSSPLYDLVRRLESDPGVYGIDVDSMGLVVWGYPRESLLNDVRKLFKVIDDSDEINGGCFMIPC